MTIVGLFGLLLSLLAWRTAFFEKGRAHAAIFALAYLAHVSASVIYFAWVQTNDADANMYYRDPYNYYAEGFGLGTRFVIYLVQFPKEYLGGTSLDYFLIFQSFGFWGLAFLMRAIQEIYQELGVKDSIYSYAVLFFPGIHFWTAAIGKDAPLFFAVSLMLWAAMHIRRRWIGLGIAVTVMLLFRPYIALVALMAIALTMFLDRRAGLLPKAGLMTLALAGVFPILGSIQDTFYVDATSAESMGNFLERYSEVTAGSGGSAVVGASYPVRMLSLMFRPLFFDASDAFGLIASFENLILIGIIIYLVRNWRLVFEIMRDVFFLRLCLMTSLALIVLFSFTFYNVGLGLRQKVMIMPGLLVLFVAVMAARQSRAVVERGSDARR